jgi:hypothetical protein
VTLSRRKQRTLSGKRDREAARFGINPISIAGGTVKVKDEVKVEFDVVALGRAGAPRSGASVVFYFERA